MAIAAYELINTDIKVIDLAFMLGYDSPEAFIRAYQSFHGVPPSVTRKTGTYYYYDRIVFQTQIYGGKSRIANKFRPDPDGKVSQFEGCKLIITKEEWLKNPAR